jgi:hypothetical protein
LSVAAFQSRRIRELLGTTLEAAQYPDYMTLVSNKVPEAFDLDFKTELYGNSDAAGRALAGDVAALDALP